MSILQRAMQRRRRQPELHLTLVPDLDGARRRLWRNLHIIEFADNGAIKRENVWIDLAAIQRQLPQD